MRSCLALLVLLALAPAASAATVSMHLQDFRDGGETSTYGSVTITAAPGEVNALDLRYSNRAFVVRDAAATLRGNSRCRNDDRHTIVCSHPDLDHLNIVEADLGDMDDSVQTPRGRGPADLELRGGPGDDVLSGLWATMDGGDGNDHLIGGAGTERLSGGAGDDTLEGHGELDFLEGGAGDDVLRGGDGHDRLSGGATIGRSRSGDDILDAGPGNDTLSDADALVGVAGADTLIGGDGRDSVRSYASRRRPVSVDLNRVEGQGEPGENDALSGIENVVGGLGDDRLIGDGAPNLIDGGRGQDEVRGGGGDDQLLSTVRSSARRPNAAAPAYGPDRVSGDAGDDVIETLATLESEVTCGDGHDRVHLPGFSAGPARSSLGPLVSQTCERLAMGSSRRRGGGVSITPYPSSVAGDAFVFSVQAAGCCRRRFELQTVESRPRLLAATRARSPAVRLRVPRAAAHARRGVRGVRGKVTDVAHNRFVWRFRAGF